MAEISNRNTAVAPSRSEYSTRWGVHENYIVTLNVFGDSSLGDNVFSVSTTIDESFSISLGATWSAPFANVMSDAMSKSSGGNILQQLGALAGMNARNKMTSAQIWQTSDPISFNIPFTFIAKSNAYLDVQKPVQSLLKLTSPYEKAGLLLEAPGPTILGQVVGGRCIQLRIGNFLKLDNCIVNKVDAQFDSIIGESGIPHKAKVTVDIESFYTCFTVQDIDEMFVTKG